MTTTGTTTTMASDRTSLSTCRRIVIKIGSSTLVAPEGEPRRAWLNGLAADIAALKAQGADVVVVSSGAIALGRRRLKLASGALKLEEAQAAANEAKADAEAKRQYAFELEQRGNQHSISEQERRARLAASAAQNRAGDKAHLSIKPESHGNLPNPLG